MKKPLLAAAILVLVLLPGPSLLAEPSADGVMEERFKLLDKNGDGKITTDELPQSAFFKERDQNGDGVITLAEVKATAPKPAPSAAADTAAASPRRKPLALRRAPKPLKPADHGVGRRMEDLEFKDLAGKRHKLSEFAERRAIVIAMTSTSCPLSKKYLPTLKELANSYAPQGIAWVLVNPQATDKPPDMQQAAKEVKGDALYVHDRDGALADALGAGTTADVIVLDAARTVVFHGAIDDQYGFGYSLQAPRQRYLADALDAILASRVPPVTATDAPGCTLNRSAPAAAPTTVTYYNRVARIVQANCVECHRDGGVAPFPLTSLEEVKAHAGMIGQVVEEGTMPPWFAAANDEEGTEHLSQWANDRTLSAEDKRDLLAWIKGGQPAGDEREAPKLRTYSKEWQVGKPDAIFEFPQAVPVQATGIMPYENILVETKLTEDKWVEAIEVQPGDKGVVHHMLVFLHGDAGANPADSPDGSSGNAFWGIYVPGNSTLMYPNGFAKKLPKGAKLHCQVHYRTNGKATTDRSRIGVVFAKHPPQHEVKVAAVINPRISIPPGASNHREEALLQLPVDVQVLSFLPHMHLRAKACRYKVTPLKGTSRTLLNIPHYDFNWQLLYRCAEPLPLQRGDTIKFTVWYDNSDKNPANPDPTQTVVYGKQINDEMHLGYFEYIIPSETMGAANK